MELSNAKLSELAGDVDYDIEKVSALTGVSFTEVKRLMAEADEVPSEERLEQCDDVYWAVKTGARRHGQPIFVVFFGGENSFLKASDALGLVRVIEEHGIR